MLVPWYRKTDYDYDILKHSQRRLLRVFGAAVMFHADQSSRSPLDASLSATSSSSTPTSMDHESADILGGRLHVPPGGHASSWTSVGAAGKLFLGAGIVLAVALCWVHLLPHWRLYRERQYRKAMRRRHGIPDSDHRPFNVAYAAAQRARQEQEAEEKGRSRPSSLQPVRGGQQATPSAETQGARQRLSRKEHHSTLYNVSDMSSLGPIPGNYRSFGEIPATEYRSSPIRSSHAFPDPFGDAVADHATATTGRTYHSTKHALEEGNGASEQEYKKSRYENEGLTDAETPTGEGIGEGAVQASMDVDLYVPENPKRGSKRSATGDDDEGIESSRSRARGKRARQFSKEHPIVEDQEMDEVDELPDILPGPRGRKRDRGEAGSTFGGDDSGIEEDSEVQTHRHRRRRVVSNKKTLAAPRGQKRHRDSTGSVETDAEDDDSSPRRVIRQRRGQSTSEEGSQYTDDGMVSHDPLCKGRRIGEEWESHGVLYKVGPNGQRLRQALVKKSRSRFPMPKDSEHPDREANIDVFVETWLSDEEYKAAKERHELAWQETPRRTAEPDSPGDVLDSPSTSGKNLLWSSMGVKESPALKRTNFRQSVATNLGLRINPFLPIQASQQPARRVSSFVPTAPTPSTPESPTLRTSKSYSKWEKQDLEAAAMAKLREKAQKQNVPAPGKSTATSGSQVSLGVPPATSTAAAVPSACTSKSFDVASKAPSAPSTNIDMSKTGSTPFSPADRNKPQPNNAAPSTSTPFSVGSKVDAAPTSSATSATIPSFAFPNSSSNSSSNASTAQQSNPFTFKPASSTPSGSAATPSPSINILGAGGDKLPTNQIPQQSQPAKPLFSFAPTAPQSNTPSSQQPEVAKPSSSPAQPSSVMAQPKAPAPLFSFGPNVPQSSAPISAPLGAAQAQPKLAGSASGSSSAGGSLFSRIGGIATNSEQGESDRSGSSAIPTITVTGAESSPSSATPAPSSSATFQPSSNAAVTNKPLFSFGVSKPSTPAPGDSSQPALDTSAASTSHGSTPTNTQSNAASGPSSQPASAFAPPSQPSSAFAQKPASAFGAPSQLPSPFAAPTSSANAGGAFGSTAFGNKPAAPASSSDSSAQKSAFSFGFAAKPAAGTFGDAAAAGKNDTGKAASPFAFGNTNATNGTNGTSNAFGSSASPLFSGKSSGSVFGQGSAPGNAAAGSAFSGANPTVGSSGTSNNAAAGHQSSISTAKPSPSFGVSAFAQSTTPTPSTNNTNGAPNAPSKPLFSFNFAANSPSPFGATAGTNTSSTSSPFGAPSPSAFGFNAPKADGTPSGATTSTGAFTFGSQPAQKCNVNVYFPQVSVNLTSDTLIELTTTRIHQIRPIEHKHTLLPFAMLSNNTPATPRPRPPAKVRRTPSLNFPPPPPYAPRLDMILDSPIPVTAQLVARGSPPPVGPKSTPEADDWMDEQSREELSDLLVRADGILKSRETELGYASALCKTLYDENISLKTKHEALLAKLPGSPTSPSSPALISTSLTRSPHYYSDSRPESPSPSPPRNSPSPQLGHLRRVSVTPAEIARLADQNAELLDKIQKLEEEAEKSDQAGKRKLRKLEKEIQLLREDLERTQERGAELEQKARVALSLSEAETQRRKEEREERVRELRERSLQSSDTLADDVRDFAPAPELPIQPSAIKTIEEVPSAPVAFSSVAKPDVFGVAESKPSYFQPPAAAASASHSIEFNLISQLLAKIRELEETNIQISSEQQATAEGLRAVQRDTESMRRAYQCLAEETNDVRVVDETSQGLSSAVTPKRGDTMKFSSLRRSINDDVDRLFEGDQDDSEDEFASGISQEMQSTRRGILEPIAQKPTQGHKSRKSVVGLFDTDPMATTSTPQTTNPEYPASLKVSSAFRTPSPAHAEWADISSWSIAATEGISFSPPMSPPHALSPATPSDLLAARHTLGSELGSEFGDDWGENAGNHHLRASSLYNLTGVLASAQCSPDGSPVTSPLAQPSFLRPIPPAEQSVSDGGWEDMDEPVITPSQAGSITPTRRTSQKGKGLQLFINPPTPQLLGTEQPQPSPAFPGALPLARSPRSLRTQKLSQTVRARTARWVEGRYGDSSSTTGSVVRRRKSGAMRNLGHGHANRPSDASMIFSETFDTVVRQLSFSASPVVDEHPDEEEEEEGVQSAMRRRNDSIATEASVVLPPPKKDGFVGFILEVWLWLQFTIVVLVFLWAMARRVNSKGGGLSGGTMPMHGRYTTSNGKMQPRSCLFICGALGKRMLELNIHVPLKAKPPLDIQSNP
ncbi:hypothetical protein K474DRAFT_1694340, partial [Panus rudis PR-1116 ss-1]